MNTMGDELNRLSDEVQNMKKDVYGIGEKVNNFECLVNHHRHEAKQANETVTKTLESMQTKQNALSEALSQNNLIDSNILDSLRVQSLKINHLKNKSDRVRDMNNALINAARKLEARMNGIEDIDFEEEMMKLLEKAKVSIENIVSQNNSLHGKFLTIIIILYHQRHLTVC